ncbi:MAG: LLM class flavin-dependent oxidoreductase [Solirubrobacterales bacterium]|nr:LLM class flavin-dependent oxidoreductase [Solirubrobacterales bacterium]
MGRRRRVPPGSSFRDVGSSSPFLLLAAIGARTSRIEMGTAVIDMRSLYFAEDAGAADLIAGGRLQLGSAGDQPGISRGSPVVGHARHISLI